MNARQTTWRIKDKLVPMHFPMVMGILNVTPDSFHAASRVDLSAALRIAEGMLNDGADIIDIGGASSRPGAVEVAENVELDRVLPVIEALTARFPKALLSIDSYRASVAKAAVESGASIVNDIGAGMLDEVMLETVAGLRVPYIAMHMQGVPPTMQQDPRYVDVAAEVTLFLSQRLRAAHEAGIADVVLDPGFGFGKTTAHNFEVLRGLELVNMLGAPVLVGLSRKRMINEVLGTSAADALNGTSVLNAIALMNGASILRVHDVKEAVECVKLVRALRS